MVCSFFGHRDASATIREQMAEAAEQLIQDGADLFLVGNQGAFDAMALGILRQLKKQYPNIRYYVVLAYLPQDRMEEFLEDETMFPEGLECVPPRFAIARRNRWMIEKTDVVISYVVHDWGGAAKIVSAAEKKGKKIMRLCEKER